LIEIVIASGKGGTGKTFVSSNLLYYLNHVSSEYRGRCIGIDADVEAPDLALSLGGYVETIYEKPSYATQRPEIDYSRCVGCGKCVSMCRYGAIKLSNGLPAIEIDECEGCGVCAAVCPVNAIYMVKHRVGRIVAGLTRYGIPIVSGELEPGKSSSGRLVYELKNVARELYGERARVFVVDAAAGIGCPTISSIAGASLVILVIEPTPQSLHGALRLKSIVETFNIRHIAIVNKYDLNPQMVVDIEREFNVVGKIPFDPAVFESYVNTVPILVHRPESRVAKALLTVFRAIMECIGH